MATPSPTPPGEGDASKWSGFKRLPVSWEGASRRLAGTMVRLGTHPASVGAQDGSFDLAAPPPFTMADLRSAIPPHCWRKNALRSLSFFVLDCALVAALAYTALSLDNW